MNNVNRGTLYLNFIIEQKFIKCNIIIDVSCVKLCSIYLLFLTIIIITIFTDKKIIQSTPKQAMAMQNVAENEFLCLPTK